MPVTGSCCVPAVARTSSLNEDLRVVLSRAGRTGAREQMSFSAGLWQWNVQGLGPLRKWRTLGSCCTSGRQVTVLSPVSSSCDKGS